MNARKPVAWMSTKFPLEIPAALGMEVLCPESAGAAAAGKGESAQLCRRAEGLGYCADLCSYVRMGMAMARDGGLPKPDVLLCCDNICSGMVQWYEAMARTLQVPLVLLNFPYRQSEVSQGQVNYLLGQLKAAIRQLEELTGRRWDPQAFQEVCRREGRSARAWQRVLDCAMAHPSPLRSMEIFDYMPLMVTGRCRPETEERLLELARELAARRPEGEEYRIYWEGTPCWPVLGQVVDLLDKRHIRVVADPISHSLGFCCQDLESLARAYCETINGVSLEEGVTMRVELCRRYGVDGVLIHYNRSCRPWCGDLQEVERRLREELGVPVVSFDGDQGDPGAFSPAQFETRLDTLTELMAARREAQT